MNELLIIKIGGNVIDHSEKLSAFLAILSKLPQQKVLVHGGGKLATELSSRLNIPTQMIDGRRITDAETLKIATMVYAGLVNKQIVAQLQSLGSNALGLTGADGNIILAQKRDKGNIDYGFVGDVLEDGVNVNFLQSLIDQNILPVVSPITHDGKGQLLNTNADTIAATLAQNLTKQYKVTLIYCFEKAGVLENPEDDNSVIPVINTENFANLKSSGIVSGGMLPKLENCFASISQGVSEVYICQAESLANWGKSEFVGTKLIA